MVADSCSIASTSSRASCRFSSTRSWSTRARARVPTPRRSPTSRLRRCSRAPTASPTGSSTPGPTMPASSSPRAPRDARGRHQAERRRLLLQPAGCSRSSRPPPARASSRSRGHLLLLPAALPLRTPRCSRATRRWSPGALRRLRRALLLEPVLAAGHRRRGHGLQLDRGGLVLHLEHPGLGARPGPQGPHLLRRPGAQGHLQRVPGALRGQVHRGLRPHRDRHGHLHGPDPAGRARLDGQGQPRLRGHDRRAGDRSAAAPRPQARSWST